MITFKQYINSQNETENNLYQTYKSSIHDAYEVAVKLINSNNDVPQHLIDSISKSLKLSLDIAKKLIKKHIEVPKQLWFTIVNSSGDIIASNLAYHYIVNSNKIFPDIPEELMNKITNSEYAMKSFLTSISNHVDILRKHKTKLQNFDKEYPIEYEKFLKKNPEFLEVTI
jgi:methyl coenzyme M reductase alpha subunit